jgi:hypothetical protein
MAIANVQTSGLKLASSNAALTWTPGTTPVVGNLVTCRTTGFNAPIGASNVGDSSGTPKLFTRDVTVTSPNGAATAIFSWTTVSGFTAPFTTSAGGAGMPPVNYCIFDEWSGAATSSVLDKTSTSSSASQASPGSTGTVTTGANCGLGLAVGCSVFVGHQITSAGSGWTQDGEDHTLNGSVDIGLTYRVGALGSLSGFGNTWTWSSGTGDWAGALATYNAAIDTSVFPGLLTPRRLRALWSSAWQWIATQ